MSPLWRDAWKRVSSRMTARRAPIPRPPLMLRPNKTPRPQPTSMMRQRWSRRAAMVHSNSGDGSSPGDAATTTDAPDAADASIGDAAADAPDAADTSSGGDAADVSDAACLSAVCTASVLAAGGGHSCAALKNQTVLCWGDNLQGQVGIGSLALTVKKPSAVPGLADVVSVATGRYHTCALRKTGAVACWGDNTEGALGDGTYTTRLTPAAVKDVSTATVLGVGFAHACVGLADKSVWCWGTSSAGECRGLHRDGGPKAKRRQLRQRTQVRLGSRFQLRAVERCERRVLGQRLRRKAHKILGLSSVTDLWPGRNTFVLWPAGT